MKQARTTKHKAPQPQPEKQVKLEKLEKQVKLEDPPKQSRIAADTPPAITAEEFAELQRTHTTKSGMIRALAAEGHPTNMIAHTLLYYQVLSPRSSYPHVRNVLSTPLKRPLADKKDT